MLLLNLLFSPYNEQLLAELARGFREAAIPAENDMRNPKSWTAGSGDRYSAFLDTGDAQRWRFPRSVNVTALVLKQSV